MKEHITRRRLAILAMIIIALIWWLWPNNRLAQVQALQQELANPDITAERRQEVFQQMRTAMTGMSPEQRAQLRNQGQKRFEEQLNRYFQMTPQEKVAYLDQQINREQQMMQPAQTNGAPKGGFGGEPPGGGGGSAKGPRSDEDRENGRQKRLDATTPEFRGQMDQYRKDMAARRQQRGLPASTRGGR